MLWKLVLGCNWPRPNRDAALWLHPYPGLSHNDLAFGNKALHLLFVRTNAVEQCQLVLGTVEIVFGILDFLVLVAVDIIGEETHTLHKGEEFGCERQVFALDGCEECACRS